MNNCPRCGLIQGLHFSTLPGCKCQWQGTLNTDYQKKWVGLTVEEASEIYNSKYNEYAVDLGIADFLMIYMAIEAKLKERNS